MVKMAPIIRNIRMKTSLLRKENPSIIANEMSIIERTMFTKKLPIHPILCLKNNKKLDTIAIK